MMVGLEVGYPVGHFDHPYLLDRIAAAVFWIAP